MEESYGNCVEKMKLFYEFEHYSKNMIGVHERREFNLRKTYVSTYCIYSYSTIICFINYFDKIYCINPYNYSRTTSKQTTLIRRAAEYWERIGFSRVLWF